MIRQKPLIARSELNSRSIEALFPNFTSYEDRSPDSFNFSGAYMLSSGWLNEENEPYEAVRYPSDRDVSNQLKYHNTNLDRTVADVMPEFLNDHLLLCDLFATAMRCAEKDRRWTLARRLFDMAITASSKNWQQMPSRVQAAIDAIEESRTAVVED